MGTNSTPYWRQRKGAESDDIFVVKMLLYDGEIGWLRYDR